MAKGAHYRLEIPQRYLRDSMGRFHLVQHLRSFVLWELDSLQQPRPQEADVSHHVGEVLDLVSWKGDAKVISEGQDVGEVEGIHPWWGSVDWFTYIRKLNTVWIDLIMTN
jgi:hypothetical protein